MIVTYMVDKDTMFKLRPGFGRDTVTTLARVRGMRVSIVGNDLLCRSGDQFQESELAASIVHGVALGESGYEAGLADIENRIDVWGLAAVYEAQAVIKPLEARDS